MTSKTEKNFHYKPEPDRIYRLVFLRLGWGGGGSEVSKWTTTQGTNHQLKLNFTLESVGKRCKEDMCVSGVNTKFFIFVFPLAQELGLRPWVVGWHTPIQNLWEYPPLPGVFSTQQHEFFVVSFSPLGLSRNLFCRLETY